MVSQENARSRELWEQLVESLAPTGPEPLTVDELRAGFDTWAEESIPVPDDARVEAVDADGVPCLWTRAPDTSDARTIIYFHGGGYVLGSATAYQGFGVELSRAADARVLVVDYRRAPEHPHPAAINDAVMAYGWLVRNGVPPGEIVVAGDSAGAGLTMALLVSIRDSGDALPAGGIPISPWVDMTFSGRSYHDRAEADPIISRELLGQMAELWLGEQDPRDVRASPLFADLRGLPPLSIFIGTAESLYDESIALYERARAAGVATELHRAEGMFHIWPVMNSFLPEARTAVEQIGEFVKKHT
ncbi:alpha/beta hydrolase [Leucobacter weissii]|uniref:Alpha/beta hydrolase n=1 Tax=Leucobacter weissii TaxID=1983706 RepID=A0A939MMJ2_9MICO|nr:alpha/beta hydrolase [Leucobacter weissii]MBO1902990.1 alpha/beta hydrolase [Leucobacter weissii]